MVEGSGPDPLIGRELQGFQLLARIGSGATGIVYRASHPEREADVAVKVLHDHMGHIEALHRRFEREAKVLKRLVHPHVVTVSHFGVVENVTFIAMELLEGETLEEMLDREPIDPADALMVMDQVLDGMAFAHDLSIVHRDLKPANVFLRSRDPLEVKLLDFGLAKFLSTDQYDGPESTLTRRGRIVGTPAYMAPEQITGVAVDVRADVYAAGVVLYELLADRRPFEYERRSQLLRAHLFEPVPPLTRVRPALTLRPELSALVLTAMEKDPGKRFANAREMLQALRELPADAAQVDGPRVGVRRRRTATFSGVISGDERDRLLAPAVVAGWREPGMPVIVDSSSAAQTEPATATPLPDHTPAPGERLAFDDPPVRPAASPATRDGGTPEKGERTPIPGTRDVTERIPALRGGPATPFTVVVWILALAAVAFLAWWLGTRA